MASGVTWPAAMARSPSFSRSSSSTMMTNLPCLKSSTASGIVANGTAPPQRPELGVRPGPELHTARISAPPLTLILSPGGGEGRVRDTRCGQDTLHVLCQDVNLDVDRVPNPLSG